MNSFLDLSETFIERALVKDVVPVMSPLEEKKISLLYLHWRRSVMILEPKRTIFSF